jgi:Leucine-rich repeat (LRR) protein
MDHAKFSPLPPTISPAPSQASERERFISELNHWTNKEPGENREAVAKLTLEAYDRTIAYPGSTVKLEIGCVVSHEKITELPPLPPGLTSLGIYKLFSLAALPSRLPDSLTHLDIAYTQITALPVLPDGLTNLAVSYTPITALPVLPNGLTSLYISSTLVAGLPVLPEGLTTLDICDSAVSALPEHLPAGLLHLAIIWSLVTELPGRLPVGVNRDALSKDVQDNIEEIRRVQEGGKPLTYPLKAGG